MSFTINNKLIVINCIFRTDFLKVLQASSRVFPWTPRVWAKMTKDVTQLSSKSSWKKSFKGSCCILGLRNCMATHPGDHPSSGSSSVQTPSFGVVASIPDLGNDSSPPKRKLERYLFHQVWSKTCMLFTRWRASDRIKKIVEEPD